MTNAIKRILLFPVANAGITVATGGKGPRKYLTEKNLQSAKTIARCQAVCNSLDGIEGEIADLFYVQAQRRADAESTRILARSTASVGLEIGRSAASAALLKRMLP